MNEIIIFGKKYKIKKINNQDREGKIEISGKFIYIPNSKNEKEIIQNFLKEVLYREAQKIYVKLLKRGSMEIFGNMKFEIVKSIDGKRYRLAKVKGNKILLSLKLLLLPKHALRYVIVHEIAHLYCSKHTEKFWKIVKIIDPKYRYYQDIFLKHSRIIINWGQIKKV